MTANTQDLRNTLEAQNFQDEQSLNKENRKTLHKMMKYVRTFPLKSIEIEQIRRDLTGMAIEAQQRGTSLQAMLEKIPGSSVMRSSIPSEASKRPEDGSFFTLPDVIIRLSVLCLLYAI